MKKMTIIFGITPYFRVMLKSKNVTKETLLKAHTWTF